MHRNQFDPEYTQSVIDAVREHGSQRKAAAVLGINQANVCRLMKTAARKGMLPMDPVMPGFEIKRVSETVDGNGNVKSRSIVQGHEPGPKFRTPEGHFVKGVSSLVNSEGQVTQQWVKTAREPLSIERLAEIAEDALSDFKPVAPTVVTKDCDSDRLAVYPWADWHIGLLAWGRETDGPDWDLSIARKVIVSTFRETVEQMPKAAHALALGLGDIMHSDNQKGTTPLSGNSLDVDSRYAKGFETALETLIECGEIVRSRHKHLDVSLKHGNHDPVGTVGLRQTLRMFYRKEKHVHVDLSPSPFFVKRFGKNLIGGVHGDSAKREHLPMIMATRWAGEWADTTTRHWHTGHIHHDTLIEMEGVPVYSHRAPVAQDAYHASAGYLSGRSMKGFVYHVEKGFRTFCETNIS
jgi:hypothetical protein